MTYLRPLSALFAVALVGPAIARADGLTTSARHASQALQNPVATLSLGQLGATRERPLLAPNRRQPSATVVVSHAPPPPPDPPKLSLSGVVVDKNGPLAVIRSDPGSKPMHVRVGDMINGWRVTQIDKQRLVISLDGRSATVMMFKSDHDDTQQIAGERPLGHMLEVNAAGLLKPHRGDP